MRFDKGVLQPFLESMFSGFFAVIESEEYGENEYVMKATMRALSVVKEDVVAITEMVLNKLTNALGRVCKNPKVSERSERALRKTRKKYASHY